MTSIKPVLRNRVFLAGDLIGWTILPGLALSLRLESFQSLGGYVAQLVGFTAIAIICKFLSLWYFGIYRRYWRYASIDELMLITAGVIVAGVAAAAAYWSLGWTPLLDGQSLPRSVPIIDTAFTLLFVGGTRFSVRVVRRLRQRLRGRPAGRPVLIIGAGDAGTMIARELQENPQLKLEPIGFIDDDPFKRNRTILGLRILGAREDIPEVVRGHSRCTAIIAMPKVAGREIREIREICDEIGLEVKTMPGMYDIIAGKVQVSQLRDVQIEDLLRREPVEIDQGAVEEFVKGRTVLVTGAGGSIGSEICRQVARLGASEIVLLGHGENSIFDIHNELIAAPYDARVVPIIADIRDKHRIATVFESWSPEVVFHAAAHKHVPLMELNPSEAVTNNVGGTLNVTGAAERSGVSNFVLVSTDKAVNPANIMGATKLLAEAIVRDAAARSSGAFVVVRFGNVLASRGSVVPLFRRQIAQGGPVTVTHPDMTRYFMTIPEAVQLVLQAAALGEGGEIFVLDMGEPVKIVDLARDLIELSGFEVGKDVEIAYTGLRPGEKLFEELFNAAEEYERTEHGKIFVARNGVTSSSAFDGISKLVAAADEGKTDEMRECLAGLLPHLGWDISSTGGLPRTTVGGMETAAVERRWARAGSDAR